MQSNTSYNLFKRHPALMGGGVALGFRYVCCDMMVQYTEQRGAKGEIDGNGAGAIIGGGNHEKEESSFFSRFDYRRNAVLACFGFLYGTGPGYLCYVKLYPILFKSKPLRAAIFDVTVQCNLLYYPLYYLVYDFIKNPYFENEEDRLETTSLVSKTYDMFERALTMQGRNFFEDTVSMSAFWIPAHYANFKYVPVHYRMPFMSTIGLGWGAILSFTRGG
jgi:hypothetical protein